MLETRYEGFRSIALAMRTSERQVLQWAKRKVDPLRLAVYQGMPRTTASHIRDWMNRYLETPGQDKLHGWEAIRKRAEMSRMAAIRASELQDDPLPVVRREGAIVWAYVTAVDDWRAAHVWSYAAWRVLRKPRARKKKE